MRLLKDISIVTHCVSNLDSEIAAWTSQLDYRVLTAGVLPAELCHAWNTPADQGLPFAVLGPASGAAVFIRLIQAGARSGYWPPVTWGWNVTEILVEDPDQLARQFAGSPFRRLGGPGDLYSSPKAPRAIQTCGPAGTTLYFTRILPGGSRYGLHGAQSRVDRVFNVIVGGPSMDALRNFYGNTLGLRVSEPIPFVMTMAAAATGAPPDTLFPIAVATVRPRNCIIELDEYPATTSARPRGKGQLPGGISMVSFKVDNLDDIALPFRAPPIAINDAPYDGRRIAVIEGPAGEWLELVENRPTGANG
jgi:catechol 2,3-dioxygenase-like lactoylglutathione lyase family enzyme